MSAVIFKPLTVSHAPENIQLDITTLCNLRCKMCLRDAIDEPAKNKSMEFEKFKAVFDAVLPGSVNLASSGEPLLHGDFFEIVRYSKARNNAVTITSTNFTLANEKVLNDIVYSGLDILKISLDAASAPVYKEIRGQDSCKAITENIKRLNKLKIERNSKTPSIRLDFVMQKDNYRELSGMVDLAQELSADAASFRIMDLSRMGEAGKNGLLSGFDAAELASELRKAGRLARQVGLTTNIEYLLGHPEYIEANYGSREVDLKRGVCLLPWLQLFVTVEGDVSPCCSLYPAGEKGEGAVGNIFKDGFERVWNGDKMQALRKIFRGKRNYKLFKACQKCNPMTCMNLISSVRLFPGLVKLKQ